MGANLGGGALENNGTRRRRRKKYKPMAEINVTPFVDVMLVLLIVFMVTAPLLTVGVPIELPKTDAKQLAGKQREPLTITVDKEGKVYIQETQIALSEVVPKVKAIAKSGFDEEIYVHGDAKTQYGVIAKVMGAISGAGFRKINLVTDAK